MTSEIFYEGDLRTKAVHKSSGTVIYTDAPLDNMGKGERFSPTDLMSTSLACCMLTIIGIAANHHGFEIKGTRVELTKIMQNAPRKVQKIIIKMYFPQNYSGKIQKIIEHAAHTCPVALSLGNNVEQLIEFNYQEA